MKDNPTAWTVNNGFALSKMLLTYHFEVLIDSKVVVRFFFRANAFCLRYEKSEIRPWKDMGTYTGTKFKIRCPINTARNTKLSVELLFSFLFISASLFR